MRTLTGICVFALCLAGCGGVAKVNDPDAVYEVTVVDAETYAAAENHFAGSEDKAMVTPYVTTYWNDERCQELLDKRDALVAIAASLGGLTGLGGLTSVIPSDMPDDKRQDMQLGLGITTVGLAAAGTGIVIASKSMTTKFEMYCSTQAPVPYEHPAEDEVDAADAGVD